MFLMLFVCTVCLCVTCYICVSYLCSYFLCCTQLPLTKTDLDLINNGCNIITTSSTDLALHSFNIVRLMMEMIKTDAVVFLLHSFFFLIISWHLHQPKVLCNFFHRFSFLFKGLLPKTFKQTLMCKIGSPLKDLDITLLVNVFAYNLLLLLYLDSFKNSDTSLCHAT